MYEIPCAFFERKNNSIPKIQLKKEAITDC